MKFFKRKVIGSMKKVILIGKINGKKEGIGMVRKICYDVLELCDDKDVRSILAEPIIELIKRGINNWDINLIESNRQMLLEIAMEATMDYYEGNTLEEQIIGLHRLVKLHYDLLNKLGF